MPGLARLVEHNGAGVLAQVPDLTLLSQTQDVLMVEHGLRAQSAYLFKYVNVFISGGRRFLFTLIFRTLESNSHTGQKENVQL